MTKFIEVVSQKGATHLIPIDKILSVIEYDGKTTIYIEPNGQCTPKNTYKEIKEMIIEAENKQNSVANAILEVDQTLYHRLR